jgi:hypothetical protein
MQRMWRAEAACCSKVIPLMRGNWRGGIFSRFGITLEGMTQSLRKLITSRRLKLSRLAEPGLCYHALPPFAGVFENRRGKGIELRRYKSRVAKVTTLHAYRVSLILCCIFAAFEVYDIAGMVRRCCQRGMCKCLSFELLTRLLRGRRWDRVVTAVALEPVDHRARTPSVTRRVSVST